MSCSFLNVRRRSTALATLFALCLVAAISPSACAQTANQPADEADRRFQEATTPQSAAAPSTPAPSAAAPAQQDEGINLLEMASPSVGGVFMYPIYGFSFVVVLFGIERTLALRRRKVIPHELTSGFGDLANSSAGFDPRKAYRLCQQYPSTAANVVKAMLLKLGRSQTEIETAVEKSKETEAAHLYNNIRPLNLSATAAPLLGLLGTVQGMIMAFYVTAHLPDGANKAQQLAEGVYVALVTTFAGLCVAIPAVCISHFLEGRIQRLFHEVDALVQSLLPQLERFEGKLRVNRQQAAADGQATERGDAAEKPQPAPATAT